MLSARSETQDLHNSTAGTFGTSRVPVPVSSVGLRDHFCLFVCFVTGDTELLMSDFLTILFACFVRGGREGHWDWRGEDAVAVPTALSSLLALV